MAWQGRLRWEGDRFPVPSLTHCIAVAVFPVDCVQFNEGEFNLVPVIG